MVGQTAVALQIQLQSMTTSSSQDHWRNNSSRFLKCPPDSLQPGVAGGCPDRFSRWKEGHEWLVVNEDGLVKCTVFSDGRTLGPLTQERVHIGPAFINRIVAKSAKKLHNKVSKH